MEQIAKKMKKLVKEMIINTTIIVKIITFFTLFHINMTEYETDNVFDILNDEEELDDSWIKEIEMRNYIVHFILKKMKL